jgi:hypothetical protein
MNAIIPMHAFVWNVQDMNSAIRCMDALLRKHNLGYITNDEPSGVVTLHTPHREHVP